MKADEFPRTPLADNFDLGYESDLAGFDQSYSLDDIDAIMNWSDAGSGQKVSALHRLVDLLEARQSLDESSELGDLIEQAKRAIGALATDGDDIDAV